MNSFDVVRNFEDKVARFAGSKYCVAVATGTWAIFLSCVRRSVKHCVLPARTFVSVPMAVLQAGGTVEFDPYYWRGVYTIKPYGIVDGALRWQRGMYKGGLHCLSFHARKHLPIGEGGAILCDDKDDYEWLRAASYCGRRAPLYRVEDVSMMGWNAYMNPEKAARGLHLMGYTQDEPDQIIDYPDLRQVPLFNASSPNA